MVSARDSSSLSFAAGIMSAWTEGEREGNELDWDWIGLDWIGLGPDRIGSDQIGLHWTGLILVAEIMVF